MLAAFTTFSASYSPASLTQFNRLSLRVRLVLAFALLFLTIFMRYATTLAPIVPALVCAAALLLLAVVGQRAAGRTPRLLTAVTALLFAFDLAVLTFLVNYSGGLGSIFLFGYFAVIAAAGMVFAADGAYAAATAATLALGALTLGKFFHLPPAIPFFPFERELASEPGLLFLTLTVICFLFYLTALFTSRICQLILDARAGELRAVRQAAAEQRLAATGRLAAGLAHELNNPLAGISSYIQYLMAAPQPPTAAQLQPVLDEVERATRTIRPLLQLARGDGDRPVIAPVALADVLAEVQTLFAPTLAGSDLRVVIDLPPVTVLASADLLKQILLNLLRNAAAATPRGGQIVISRAAPAKSPPGNGSTPARAGFSVRDTGCGIAPELLDRICEPFYTTKPPGAGTGLGLTVTRQIVRDLDGEMLIASTPGQGTTVTVFLPAAAEDGHA